MASDITAGLASRENDSLVCHDTGSGVAAMPVFHHLVQYLALFADDKVGFAQLDENSCLVAI